MGMPGGQPSITQPIAGPCDSPKVVTRSSWPKVFKRRSEQALGCRFVRDRRRGLRGPVRAQVRELADARVLGDQVVAFEDRKSTRLNSSHVEISYAVFCLKKKK